MKTNFARDRQQHPSVRLWGVAGVFLIVLMAGQTAYELNQPAPKPLSHSVNEAGFEYPDTDLNDWRDDYQQRFPGWERPTGPPLVALQAGHWLKEQAPDELEKLRDNGTSAAGYLEVDVNLRIAQEVRRQLAEQGIESEILPTTIPPSYYADLFVAIHADGNRDRRVNGYKVASPWWDVTGNAWQFARLIDEEYGQATGLRWDDNITVNMRGYYAFNWRRYRHALHPMTVATILETGFLSNYGDRQVIVEQPELAASGVTRAIIRMLDQLGLADQPSGLSPPIESPTPDSA
jgi:hypothetical protein